MGFEKVNHPFVVTDYNRSGEDNFHFLGVVGSLARTARNSDWVRVETSGYNFAAHGQLVHKSNKWVVPLVFALLVVLRGYFDLLMSFIVLFRVPLAVFCLFWRPL